MDEFEQTLKDEKTGKPGALQSMGSQGIRHSLATEQQHNEILSYNSC